ncbi:MAG: glycosyltransferase family 2 protein [Deltaproteobacteria bacterium HGW-Deltaproteobacteria-13]|nr:MAG: glycosyltransferase family 2 protein [Deltaproteobacteria bacterium HGW-Deltaproteobacteria-13]
MKPIISVIIPVFNGEHYLAEAIESVLSQKGFSLDIIVVDDGSTDRTSQIVQEYIPSLRYFFQDNAGSGAARNKGIKEARGDFFSFLDADDIWLSNKLDIQIQAFLADAELEAVFGHVKQFFSPELDEEFKSRFFCAPEALPGCLPATMLIKRDAFFRVGLFDENWRVGEEVAWILRARELHMKTIMLTDLTYMRRLHKNNKGIVSRPFINDRVKIIKAHLDAKRKK